MLTHSQEIILNRILSGTIYCQLDGEAFLIKHTSPFHRYLAEEVYREVYEECVLTGLYTDEQRIEMLIRKGFWSKDEEKRITQLRKEIKNFKHEIFKSFFKVSKRKTLKKAVTAAQNELSKLLTRQNKYFQETCEGRAGIAKLKYVLGSSVYNENGEPLFNYKHFWRETSYILDKVVAFYNEHRIDESDYRVLARSDEWRIYWSCKKARMPVFPGTILDLTDEQRQLIYWTNLFDSIYESPDCPEEEILNDDDATDGFLIEQSNKRKEADKAKQAENFTENEKIKNAGEVFVVAGSREEIARINDMNDEEAQAIKEQREKFIKAKGRANELELPDVKRRLMMEMTQKQFGGK